MHEHTQQPPIVVDQLHKQYRDTHAVRGLSFEVRAGQVLGLVGPNGAGKTTTMRCACGIIPPSPPTGTLSIDGHDVVRDPVGAKRRLAYVPDDPHLFESLTVWEHVRFTASAFRVADWEARGDALLEQFELTEKKHAITQELSRGMRQKTAICCAYLHQPRAIWLDEPLTGLDPRGIRTMKDSIRRMVADNAAAVISSHLLSLVEDICTHLLIVHRGQRLFFGSMADARETMRGHGDATLEEFFFRMTEGGPVAMHDGAATQAGIGSGAGDRA